MGGHTSWDGEMAEPLWKVGAHAGPLGVGIEVAIPYEPGMLAKIVKAEIVDPLTLLFQKVLHVVEFVGEPAGVRAGRTRSPDELTIGVLRDQLAKWQRGGSRVPKAPVFVRVTGIFSPAVLLSKGWWERTRPGATPVGRNDVQRWTYAGFEEWGPSWDFNSDSDEQNEQYFLGQLGEGDEADSVLVVAVGKRARSIRSGIAPLIKERKVGALAVEITGLLCHRSHLRKRNPELGAIADRWPPDFNYCLLLDADSHRINPVYEVPDFYSAYLWKCLWAKEKARDKELPALNDCYLIWEHTDLTKPGAIAYGLDGLEHKEEFLRREYGNMELLQKSGPLVPGSPGLAVGSFQRLLGAISKL